MARRLKMVVVDEKTCLKCHTGDDKVPEGHKELAKFDFAKMKEKGAHAKAVKKEAK